MTASVTQTLLVHTYNHILLRSVRVLVGLRISVNLKSNRKVESFVAFLFSIHLRL